MSARTRLTAAERRAIAERARYGVTAGDTVTITPSGRTGTVHALVCSGPVGSTNDADYSLSHIVVIVPGLADWQFAKPADFTVVDA